MSTDLLPVFGVCDPCATYISRPGAYVVLSDAQRRVAVVKTQSGLFLPGGGTHQPESPEQTAIRETLEECALDIRVLAKIGEAHEFMFSENEGLHYRKEGIFFVASAIGPRGAAESGTALLWMSVAEALATLKQLSHRWAVAQALPNPSLKRTPRARGFATVPGSRLA
ncbi:MAG: NUDIX domain-containing protein [Gemmatimonadaceae bacterium]